MKLRGKIKGQTIVIDEPLHLLEGLSVEVEITPCTEDDKAIVARRELLAKYGIRPTPSRGNVVTNEMVNQIRDDLGI